MKGKKDLGKQSNEDRSDQNEGWRKVKTVAGKGHCLKLGKELISVEESSRGKKMEGLLGAVQGGEETANVRVYCRA